MVKNLGIVMLLVGAILLIYIGLVGVGQSNVLLGIGFLLVLLGFIAQILIGKYYDKGEA